jgi:hypothetical protein
VGEAVDRGPIKSGPWIRDPAALDSRERRERRLAGRRETQRHAVGERRRSGGLGAGVHHSARGLHRDDDERLANSLVTFPGGDGEG